MLLRLLYVGLMFLSLQSCSAESPFKSNKGSSGNTIWVFAQFNVVEENDAIDTFWYYGRISKDLYQDIKTNQRQSGFIILNDVHYWGDGDVLYQYEDEEETGELLFRIEHLVRMRLVKKLPENEAAHLENLQQETNNEDTH